LLRDQFKHCVREKVPGFLYVMASGSPVLMMRAGTLMRLQVHHPTMALLAGACHQEPKPVVRIWDDWFTGHLQRFR
jgi:hypothetical protein